MIPSQPNSITTYPNMKTPIQNQSPFCFITKI